MIGTGDMQRAALYHRLSAAERAGIPILTSLGRAVESGSAGKVLEPVRERLAAGDDMGKAVDAAPGLSRLERSLIRVGAKGGKLPEVFDALAQLLEDRVAAARKLAGGLAYPVFLLHAAAFLPSLPVLITKGVIDFIVTAFTPIVIGWGVVVGGLLLLRSVRRANPAGVDAAVLRVPLLAAMVRNQSLALGFAALKICVQSGVPLLEGLELTAHAVPNRAVAQVFERARQRMVDEQISFGGAIAFEKELPADAVDLLTTGEQTGQLDTMLGRAAERVETEAKQARTVGIVVLSTGAFLCAAGFVAFKVISFYAGMFSQFEKDF